MSKDVLPFDVVIVGGGPSGLAAACRLAQLSQTQGKPLDICLIDKGAEIGSHILSGAVLEPRALDELFPEWRHEPTPFLYTPVSDDHFIFLTSNKHFRLPTPPPMHNRGNFIISLGLLCKWLAQKAENLGVQIFPGFAATELYYENDRVVGVITGDKGVDRRGNPKPQYQPGVILTGKQILIAEGCRGSLTRTLITKYSLYQPHQHQTYGLGIKEVWEIDKADHRPGYVAHTIGWPLDQHTYGGSFIYHWGEKWLSIGMVVGLDYHNPYLNPYEEFQRLKTHPFLKTVLTRGKRIAYGARTLVEGGIQSLPQLTFPGGLLLGDAAGFLNVPKIKGIHNAMKSGMIAAETIFPLLNADTLPEPIPYLKQIKTSWLWKDLYRVRNIRPALRLGLIPGLIYAALDTYFFRGHTPFTFKHGKPDHDCLKKANQCRKIDYPKHDNIVTFDIASSTFLANIQYDEDQPYHLKLKSRHEVPIQINLKEYAAPETRYCPAGVYEILWNEAGDCRLQINGGNCIHCKACDIKDPTQNIVWTPSEGGSGPHYEIM